MNGGNKFQACRDLRAMMGWGLKESNDFIDRYSSPAEALAAAQKLKDEAGGKSVETKDSQIRMVIHEVYAELNESGFDPDTCVEAFNKIEDIMGMAYTSWSGHPRFHQK